MKKFLSATLIALALATSATAQYCAVSFSFPCGGNEYISNVTCGPINNTSACGLSYEDFSAQQVTFPSGGSSFPIDVTVSSWFSATDTCAVFVDWNGDFAFNTTTERTALVQGVGSSAATHYTGTITAPAGQAPGSYRMRVFMNYGSNLGPPCGALSFGDAEDYTAVVGAPTPPQYQVNQTGASFTLDGLAGTAFTVATTNKTADNVCSFGATTVAFTSTNVGNPWDLAIGTVPAVPAAGPGFVLNAGPQIVNINFGDPTLVFLNAFPALTTPFPGNFNLVYAPGGPTFACAQMLVLDGAQIDGVSLSQANQYNCAYGASAGIAVPLSDDGAAVYSLADPALACSTGNFSFYGTNYTQVCVHLNGRISFGGLLVANDYNPVVTGAAANGNAAADAGEPFFGAWCDFSVALNASGTVTLSAPFPGVIQLAYANDAYFGNPALQSSFSLLMDQNSTDMTITNVSSFPVFPVTAGATPVMFLGISPGLAGGATDPGPASWALGFNAGPPNPTDMHYVYGQPGGLVTGISYITFVSNFNGYDVNAY